MSTEQLVLSIERLRSALEDLRSELRKRYRDPQAPITANDLKSKVARLAETWMVELAQRPEVVLYTSADYRADLTIHFQRLLTFSERASKRSLYESEMKAILKRFTLDLVIPIKQ